MRNPGSGVFAAFHRPDGLRAAVRSSSAPRRSARRRIGRRRSSSPSSYSARCRCSASATSFRPPTRCCAIIRSPRHLRFLLEEIRPGDAAVFLREREGRHCRSRATSAPSSISAPRCSSTNGRSAPSTTSMRDGYEWLQPFDGAGRARRRSRSASTSAVPTARKPYAASIFNISAMSFGALSPNAIRALNTGAKKGGFAHDTGEGGFSPYHRENGGDIIWEIGSGYFGCRNADGTFCADKFAATAAATTRSRWWSSSSARAPSPATAACCPAPR